MVPSIGPLADTGKANEPGFERPANTARPRTNLTSLPTGRQSNAHALARPGRLSPPWPQLLSIPTSTPSIRANVGNRSCARGANLHGNRIELELPRRLTLTARNFPMLSHTLD